MINTKQKGWRIQRLAIQSLIENGYEVDKVEKTGKFQKQKDMFGIFDLVAITKDITAFIQITCNKPHTHEQYKIFSLKYPLITTLQMVWIDRKGFRTIQYLKGQKIEKK